MTDNLPARRNLLSRIPFQVILEPRLEEPPRWYPWFITILAVVIALLIGAVILALAGGNPWATYAHIGRAAFGNLGVLSDTMVKAIPLMIVGLACSLAFRMRIWNIGAEGQFFMGAFGASAVVLTPMLPADAPSWLFIPCMLIAGMLCGAIWGFIPGFLKAKFNVNEIISTLMMNYIAISWNNYWIFAVWTEGGFQMSRVFPRNAWLPRLTDFAAEVPLFRGLTTHFGLVLALVAAVIVWLILYRSQWGYEIRLVGDNPRAAHYAGISIGRNIVYVMMLSGALAGMAGMSEISGVVHRLQGAISPGYGFTGIIVAWLAKLNPLAVIPVSILFGALILAGREIQPSGIPKMMNGIILVCLIASDFLLRYRISITRRMEEE
ncbi:nucleoside ABC transporter membrane protein [Anaerolinea thermolimosa]|uniref:ABC transporter permease n=1 Tax=Anaerolinea thermolimosa TaxID=229919 RepID=UPI000780E829|nr:ABC transporter permease [Anaerolinea thermolimosa]GAP07823.1 nucleoside ABC transporter membrane protein [Anaerolinea thermolimosa]